MKDERNSLKKDRKQGEKMIILLNLEQKTRVSRIKVWKRE